MDGVPKLMLSTSHSNGFSNTCCWTSFYSIFVNWQLSPRCKFSIPEKRKDLNESHQKIALKWRFSNSTCSVGHVRTY